MVASAEPVGDTERSAARGFGMTTAFLALVMLISWWAQLPTGAAPSWLSDRSATFSRLWPQSWPFFADAAERSPLVVYRDDGGTLVPAGQLHAAAGNLWGVGRDASALATVAGTLALRLPADAWQACPASAVRECAARLPVVDVANTFEPTLLCGFYYFVRGPVEVTAATSESVASVRLSCP